AQRARLAVLGRLALEAGRGDRVLRVLDERLVERGAWPLVAVLVALAERGERDLVVLDVAVAIDEAGEDDAAGGDRRHAGRFALGRGADLGDLLAVDHEPAVADHAG